MDLQKLFTENREALGVHQLGFTTTDQLVFSPDVRQLCEVNYCGKYGTSWACPPGCGSYEECQEKVMKYKNIFVYTSVHPLEDSYDFEGMMDGKEKHTEISERVIKMFRENFDGEILNLSGDGCERCAKCTYPDAPCRFPELLAPSIESHGVEVNRLAATVGINYINGVNTVTYFGCILYND